MVSGQDPQTFFSPKNLTKNMSFSFSALKNLDFITVSILKCINFTALLAHIHATL